MNITIMPVATVHNARKEAIDGNRKSVVAKTEWALQMPSQALGFITDFSHIEIICSYNLVHKEQVVYVDNSRGNLKCFVVGIFAQRKKKYQTKSDFSE